jgi:hypothetical protein
MNEEELIEFWIQDPDLYSFIMFYEDEQSENEDLDSAIERAYLMGEYDEN